MSQILLSQRDTGKSMNCSVWWLDHWTDCGRPTVKSLSRGCSWKGRLDLTDKYISEIGSSSELCCYGCREDSWIMLSGEFKLVQWWWVGSSWASVWLMSRTIREISILIWLLLFYLLVWFLPLHVIPISFTVTAHTRLWCDSVGTSKLILGKSRNFQMPYRHELLR